MSPERIRAGRRSVELSRPDKVLFPGAGLTKADLADYYRRIADRILPFLRDRPISMHRFPDGITSGGFYHKRAPDSFPGWVDRVRVKVKDDGSQQQVAVNRAATLVFLADQACITPHPWLSRADRLDTPDRAVFDLDPPGGDFGAVRRAARLLRAVLQDAGLAAYVMATGSRGLHVVVPLRREHGFDVVRRIARRIARAAARRHPDELTVEQRKEKRKGRILVDYLRNAYGQTSVPPYAARARGGAPVAAPLDWDEVADAALAPDKYRVANIFRRLAHKDDPWQGFARHARSLDQARIRQLSPD